MPHNLLQTSQIDALTAGDPGFRKELIQTCLDLFKAFPSDFEAALSTRDAGKLEFVNHRIKANVLLVGAESVYDYLQQTAERMELVGMTDGEMQAALAKVRQQFRQLEEELTNALAS